MKDKIIAISDQVKQLLDKNLTIDSQGFIELAVKVMNFSDLSSNLVSIESEERKESEFQWIWKEIAQP
jgi:hypothetical protein